MLIYFDHKLLHSSFQPVLTFGMIYRKFIKCRYHMEKKLKKKGERISQKEIKRVLVEEINTILKNLCCFSHVFACCAPKELNV